MSATGVGGCGCGSCGSRARAPRRRPYDCAQPYRGAPEYMVARTSPQPQFGARLSFAAALAHADSNSVGLYRIYKDGRPLYSGRAAPGTIRSRLIQHRWCLTHMGVDPAPYTVSIAPMRGSSPALVAAAERGEIRRLRQNRVYRGTNRREGEFEGEAMLGRLWGRLTGRGNTQPLPAQQQPRPGVSPMATTGTVNPLAATQPDPRHTQQIRGGGGGGRPPAGGGGRAGGGHPPGYRLEILVGSLDGMEVDLRAAAGHPEMRARLLRSYSNQLNEIRNELAASRSQPRVSPALIQRAEQRLRQGVPQV